MKISEIEYGSYLSYASKPQPGSEIQSRSKTITYRLKNDSPWPESNLTTSELIIQRMFGQIDSLPFADFFKNKPILVPVPRSSLIKQPDTLWVPKRIATALLDRGLGSQIIECLRRVRAVPKSSSSSPKNRPKAIDHYKSFAVETLSKPNELLLVDDVVTRGATFMGAVNRLIDVFPDIKIKAFAVVRLVSSDSFTNIIDPCRDNIILQNGETYRKPDSRIFST